MGYSIMAVYHYTYTPGAYLRGKGGIWGQCPSNCPSPPWPFPPSGWVATGVISSALCCPAGSASQAPGLRKGWPAGKVPGASSRSGQAERVGSRSRPALDGEAAGPALTQSRLQSRAALKHCSCPGRSVGRPEYPRDVVGLPLQSTPRSTFRSHICHSAGRLQAAQSNSASRGATDSRRSMVPHGRRTGSLLSLSGPAGAKTTQLPFPQILLLGNQLLRKP